YGVAADIWSLTSINELQREGKGVARWNLLHPEDAPRMPYITEMLDGHEGPVVIATDYMKSHAEQLRQFIPRRYMVLGTDGYGRSDTRERLRRFFEVSREYVVLAALKALVDEGALKPGVVVDAMQALGISADKVDPTTI
ncbi:MAG: pyruvate dehydrogenase (acetyl-transferring), homodimeric type, partial [Haliea sp.]|nr:pyruvate dehydrogenase (acetyl-transferring), homodimeric type [Haliea sp.]